VTIVAPLCFAIGLAAAPTRSPSLVGRWDLTLTGPDGTHPAWLEVVPSGDSLAGRFQGAFGHATPIGAIRASSTGFTFLWPNEDESSAKPTSVEGTLGPGDRIEGTMTGASGDRWTLIGGRAPILPVPPLVSWAEPVDLLAHGLDGWRIREAGGQNGWRFEGGVLENRTPSSDLVSVQRFGNFALHIEVDVPKGGNSGIYLRGRHEIQVQDDFGQPPGSRRMGGVYGQVTPTALPARPAGEWQTFDITFVGRVVTVVLNGVTIIDGEEIPGITGGALDSDEAAPGPLMLQGDHTGIRYRNIVLTPARDDGPR
jgi:3-keto-disaccharide hydrolase